MDVGQKPNHLNSVSFFHPFISSDYYVFLHAAM
jgi:hypothetical protein